MNPRHGLLFLGLIAGVLPALGQSSTVPSNPVSASIRQTFSYNFVQRQAPAETDSVTPISLTMERMVVTDSRFLRDATDLIDRSIRRTEFNQFHLRSGGRSLRFTAFGTPVEVGLWPHVSLFASDDKFKAPSPTANLDLVRVRF